MISLPSTPPLIPLTISEVVYVAFSSTLDWLEKNSDYPPGMLANMRRVVEKYDSDRAASLKSRGFREDVIRAYTDAAASKLVEWLDAQAAKNDVSQGDFDKWYEELSGD